MKSWFLKRKIAWAAVGVVVAAAAGLIVLSVVVEIEATARFERLYSDGAPRALIVYHPSTIDAFQQDLTAAFAQGLHDRGWSVDRVTATADSAPDLSPYALIAFGTNTYYWSPDRPTSRWIERNHSGLANKACAGFVSGFGSTGQAERMLRNALRAAECRTIDVRPYWIMRPNDAQDMDSPNVGIALRLAREQGHRLAVSQASPPASR